MTMTIGASTRADDHFVTDPTPDRVTTLALDVTDTIVTEGAFGGVRQGADIAPLAAADRGGDGKFGQNVRYWPTGIWTLQPIQERGAAFQASFDYQAASYNPSNGYVGMANEVTIDAVEIAVWFRNDGLPGTSYNADIKLSNDIFIQRKFAASAPSWASSLTIGSGTQPIPSTGVPGVAVAPATDMDRVLQSVDDQPADTPWCLRWRIPGKRGDQPDYCFFFGFGQYSLVVRGDGMAQLWEHCHDSEDAYVWRLRKSFRYCQPTDAVGKFHQIIIFPHFGENDQKYIIFSGLFPEGVNNGVLSSGGSRASGGSAIRDVIYEADSAIRGGDVDEAAEPNHVTAAGPFYFDHRRDLRPMFSVHRLNFFDSGILVDQPWSIPVYADGTSTVNAVQHADVPSGASLTYVVADAATAIVSTTTRRPYVTFTFAPDSSLQNTPILYGYSIRRDATVISLTPGQFNVKGSRYSARIGAADVRSDSGHVTVYDAAGAYPRLGKRGSFRAQLKTTHTPLNGDADQDVILLDGYAAHVRRKPLGFDSADVGEGAGGLTTRNYPVDDWCAYDIELVGMWQRLTMHSALTFVAWRVYGIDPAIPKTPWKVTDAIKDILTQIGFSSGQIAGIPDLSQRFYPGLKAQATDLYLDASVNIAEFLINMVRNYLGLYLQWDPNYAADNGSWILLTQPDPMAGAVVKFVRGPDDPTALKQPFASYDIDMTGASVTTFYEYAAPSYVEEPENNHIWVCVFPKIPNAPDGIRLEQHYYNALSYQVPGMSISPDPDSPHYCPLGEKMFVLKDPTIWCGDGAKTNYSDTHLAMAQVGRRLFDFTCRGRTIQELTAPLVFIKDSVTGRYRPPRFLDKAEFDGTTGWYVRSLHPAYDCDGVQICEYELEKIESYP